MPLPRIQTERAVDAAYKALRQAIVSASLAPGARLDVDDIAGQLGVSLTPVRGAIQRLAAEGLVEIRPRSGTLVASLTWDDLKETFQIRAALESLAAELASQTLTPAHLRRLKDLLKALKKPLRTPQDRERHEQLNSEFHQVIINASGNRRLGELYTALHAHIQIARVHASESDWSSRQRQESAEHQAIVAALESHDAAAAADAVRRHVQRAADVLLAALRDRRQSAARDGA